MKAKKIILSVFLVLVVAAYAVYQRLGGSSQSNTRTTETNTNTNTNNNQNNQVAYKDGEYTGTDADTIFGKVQVSVLVKDGKIVDVKFLDFPKDQLTSKSISNHSLPILKTEVIAAQNENVDIVSGATQTSEGFKQSLASALVKAK
ncbi:MAG TPA: FMN-binding protein [Candidatus Udaeobacter sp.]|nr:FMN-binding protein [Candidatus Udaeobacter sp.]